MTRKKIPVKPLVITGFLVGTLDGIAAALSYYISTEKDPLNVYRFVASGVFGSEAFSGGIPMAIWGIVFHYTIAFCWTILFFALATRTRLLLKNWIVSGILYGIFVWVVMNLVVMPLSYVPMSAGSNEWASILHGTLVIILCIGLPVAYAAKRQLRNY